MRKEIGSFIKRPIKIQAIQITENDNFMEYIGRFFSDIKLLRVGRKLLNDKVKTWWTKEKRSLKDEIKHRNY